MANGGEGGRNWAVALVHGVGITEPVEMLKEVTGAVATQRRDLVLDPDVRVHLPPEPDEKDAAKAEPPAPKDPATGLEQAPPDIDPLLDLPVRQHVRHGTIGGSKVRFATAYWSDISLFGDSLVKLIGNLALGGMGVRYFADVSTNGRSIGARILHYLFAAKITLLALVFLPVVICTLIYSLYAFMGAYLFRDATLRYQAAFIAIFAFGTVAYISYLGISGFWKIRKERKLAVPIFSVLAGLATLTSLVILIDHPRTLGTFTGLDGKIAEWLRTVPMLWYADVSKNPYWYDRMQFVDETAVYILFLQLLQLVCGFFVIVLIALVLAVLLANWTFSLGTREERRGQRLGAVSVTTMWLLMLLVLWVENVVTSTTLHLYHNTHLKTWAPRADLWTFILQDWRFDTIKNVAKLEDLQQYIPLLWFDIYFSIYLIGVTVLGFVLLARRKIWCRSLRGLSDTQLDSYRPPTDGTGKPQGIRPRLILAYSYQVAVIIFMLLISITALAHYYQFDGWIVENIFRVKEGSKAPHEIFMRLANVTMVVIVGLSIFMFFAHSIKLAVKLALDVVNHFAAPHDEFPIRRRIAKRLKDTLKFLLKDKDTPHLVVISHSQGTVISLDTLLGYFDREGEWRPGLWQTSLHKEVASLTILTFGSPITHLYQHYFSSLYPKLAEIKELEFLKEARESGRIKWLNCYRIDDYIGTYIDPSLKTFPINVPMSVGGHTDYWKEDVFKRLFAQEEMKGVLVDTARVGGVG